MATYIVETIGKHGNIRRTKMVEAESVNDAERQVPLKQGEVSRDVCRLEDDCEAIHPKKDGRYRLSKAPYDD